MSWLFSQVLVEEYLGDISSDGEQSVQSSGNPTQQAYCAPDKMTVFSRLSRFGMTYKPLTEDRGEELLMSYRAAFPARTSLPQEKEQGLTESEAECGEKWRGWLAKYDPDSCSWRTAQCSLLEDLNECLETLPRSGMTRDGLLWELPMLAHHTSETESGLWPTPVAQHGWDVLRGQLGESQESKSRNCGGDMAHPKNERNVRRLGELGVTQEEHDHRRGKEDGGGQWWATEPNVGRVADGVACRVDRLKAIGNGQVPEVARRAWEALNETNWEKHLKKHKVTRM
jgi:hypothetical protein